MDNGRLPLEVISYSPTGFIHFIQNVDKYLQAFLRMCFFDQLFDHFNTGKNHTLASSSYMRKETMFNRVIL